MTLMLIILLMTTTTIVSVGMITMNEISCRIRIKEIERKRGEDLRFHKKKYKNLLDKAEYRLRVEAEKVGAYKEENRKLTQYIEALEGRVIPDVPCNLISLVDQGG